MLFLTHLFGGILGALIFARIIGTQSILLYVFFIIGSLLPDIDHPASKLGKKVKLIGWIFGHRKSFHSIFLPLVLGMPLIFVSLDLFYAFLFGFLIHLILDALTIKGVMPFYPLNKSVIKGWIKTGSFLEYVLMFVLLISIIILFF